MHEINLPEIVGYIERASYLGVFLLALLGGYLVPLPEAVILMLAGFAAAKGLLSLELTLLIALLGGILGDLLLFELSLNGSRYVEHFRHKVRNSKMEKYKHYVVKHLGKTVFFLRFVVGVRFFSPVLAGMAGVKWRNFLFFQGLASSLNAVFFVLLGYFFKKHIFFAITSVEIVKNILLISSALIASILVGFFIEKRDISKKE